MTRLKASQAALATLAILQVVMLAALISKTMPHPPPTTPLFAMGPFIAMSLSLVAATFLFGCSETGTGRILGVLASLSALLSFGPQKWVDASIAAIWPAVLSGQIAASALIVVALLGSKQSRGS